MANYADYNLCVGVMAEKAKEFVATGGEFITASRRPSLGSQSIKSRLCASKLKV